MLTQVHCVKEARRARQIQFMARPAEAVIAGQAVTCTVQRVKQDEGCWWVDYTIVKPMARSPYNLKRRFR